MQAIRAHQKFSVLAQPGEMDLTAHVDFVVPDRKIWEDSESIADKLVRYAAVLA